MIRSVKIKLMQSPELEALLPIDRVIEIDDMGRCSLYDQQLIIDDQIGEVLT
jgi:hypothetical protein